MLTQFRTGSDTIATFVGKEFGGVAGPMAAQAVRTREEPVGAKPPAPTGDDANPGTIKMLKWEVQWKAYNKKN